jgi:hypothetical protein
MQKQRRRKRRRDGAKEAYWRGHVEAQVRSGLGVRAFCQELGLAENLFYAWRRELTARDREQALASTAAPDVNRTPEAHQTAALGGAFAEVLLSGAAEPRPATSRPAIEIILDHSRRVAIAPGFDPATLTAVLDLLERRPC